LPAASSASRPTGTGNLTGVLPRIGEPGERLYFRRSTLDAYRELFRLVPFPFSRYLLNSVFVATSVTVLSLIVNALAAYSFAKLEFPGSGVLFGIFLSTMIVPFEVLAIPLYIQVRSLGWVNTYQALIIPFVANPLGIFLLRQFFLQVPRELQDAARIDGAGHLRFLWHVALPLVRPALITVSLIGFLSSWNAFLWPFIATATPEIRPIQVQLLQFSNEGGSQYHLLMAGAAFVILPTLVVYLIAQRYFIEGVARTGIRG
jgi:multiple sugar transport system permease protein